MPARILGKGFLASLLVIPLLLVGCNHDEQAVGDDSIGVDLTVFVRTNPIVLEPGLNQPQIDFAEESEFCDQIKNAVKFSWQSTQEGAPKTIVFSNDIFAGVSLGDSNEVDCFFTAGISVEPGEYEISAITDATDVLPDWSASCVTVIGSLGSDVILQPRVKFRQNKFLSPIGHPGCCAEGDPQVDVGTPPNC